MTEKKLAKKAEETMRILANYMIDRMIEDQKNAPLQFKKISHTIENRLKE